MSSELVSVQKQGPCVLWTICREGRRNAINPDVVTGLEDALDETLADPEVRTLVITGEGQRAFISGADLGFLVSTASGSSEGEDARRRFNDRMRNLLDRLARLPIPVIAAIEGHVMGGGCEVAAACDMRIAGDGATFTFKHAAMGVTPGWGGLSRIARLVPRGIASRLLMTGLPMEAREALRVGLLDEVVPAGEALARCKALAEAVAGLSAEAIAEIKGLLSAAYEGTDDRQQRLELAAFERRAAARDHAEALEAYAGGRSPRFAPRPGTLLPPHS